MRGASIFQQENNAQIKQIGTAAFYIMIIVGAIGVVIGGVGIVAAKCTNCFSLGLVSIGIGFIF